MKSLKIILFAQIVILVLLTFSFSASALSTNLDIESEKPDSGIPVQLLTKEPAREPINCFDVNENGLIAVGMEKTDDITIMVIDTDGVFQYGYEIKAVGSYAVEWGDEDLNVYLSRNNEIISVNKDGIITGSARVKNGTENDNYLRNTLGSTVKTVGEKEYRIKAGDSSFSFPGSGNFSRLTVTENGNERILYVIPYSTSLSRKILIVVGVPLFLIAGTAIIYKALVKPDIRQTSANKDGK